MAISKIQNISKEELTRIEKVIGESFVTNELFHNWGTIEERRSAVLAYMKIYVDCVYRAGELYGNETLTGFVGIEDTRRPATAAKINMLFKMIFMLPISKIKRLMHFIKQIQSSNAEYAKEPHLDILLVCVDKEHQGMGIATELVDFAKKMSDDKGLPILFDTDMKDYAEIYQHLGCRLYNQETADNSVTRYSLVYQKESNLCS